MARLPLAECRPSARHNVEWQDCANSDLEVSRSGTTDGAQAEYRWRCASLSLTTVRRNLTHRLAEDNSILGGEFVDILNGNRRILIRSLKLVLRGGGRMIRCRTGRRHNEFLEPGR